MLQYLVILLDDTSTSYCHYVNNKVNRNLISIEYLKAGIFFAMKENLHIQFVYPDYDLPNEYKEVIETMDHSKIVPFGYKGEAAVITLNKWEGLSTLSIEQGTSYILQSSKDDLFNCYMQLEEVLRKGVFLNIALTDIETFTETDFEKYKEVLEQLSSTLESLYKEGLSPQLNLLTGRIMLKEMNNCNAGYKNITLAPNGAFYVCPTFYLENEADSIGNLSKGVDIKNPQLYKLTHAPICKTCDAYQCRRCIFMNQKMTLEVNTPSHEQCVISHLERNASRTLLSNIRLHQTYFPEQNIKEINYLDPFEIVKRF